MHRHAVIAASAFALLPGAAIADDDWAPTGGPPGGALDAIASSGTRALAVGRSLFLTETSGSQWTLLGSRPGRATAAVAIDETFFIATDDARIYRTDGAAGAFATSPGTQGISLLAADRADLYAIASDTTSQAVGDLFVSEDGAQSWSRINTPAEVIAAYKSGDTILATLPGAFEQIIRSIDGGATWQTIGSGAGLPQFSVVAGYAGSGDIVFASAAGYTGSASVIRSDDLGQTWQDAGSGLGARDVKDIAVGEDHVFVVAGGRTTIDVWRAPITGGAWTLVGDDLFTSYYEAKGDLTISPGLLLLATSGDGVLMSSDNGDTWEPANTGLGGRTAYAMSATQTELLLTTSDPGDLWRFDGSSRQWSSVPFPSSLAQVRTVDAVAPSTFLAGADLGGVRLSTDGGLTWRAVNSGVPMYQGLSGEQLREFDAFASRAGTWLGASGAGAEWPQHGHAAVETGGGGLIRSTNGASSWQRITTGLPIIDIGGGGDPHYPAALSLIAVEAPFQGFLMGTKAHGVFRSSDDGLSWTAANSGIPNSMITYGRAPIAALAQFNRELFAASYAPDIGATVLRSTNAVSWSPVAGLPHAPTYALAAHNGRLYAGLGPVISGVTAGDGGGVWSTADGVTWAPVGQALEGRSVTALTVLDGDLIASADGAGVWILETCRPDLDGNGALDIFDFLMFQDLFAAGDPRADFTGDGTLDIFDLLAFQDEFTAGCA